MENRFGLFGLQSPPVWKFDMVICTYGSDTVRKKTNRKQKDLHCKCQKLGQSRRGLRNGGSSPKFAEKIGQKSFRKKNRAFSGFIGAFSAAGRQQKVPSKGLFGPNWRLLGFLPPFAKPPIGFPQKRRIPQKGIFCCVWPQSCLMKGNGEALVPQPLDLQPLSPMSSAQQCFLCKRGTSKSGSISGIN